MVVQPARSSPLTPFAEKADWMTACQKGDTALDQSSVLMSCISTKALHADQGSTKLA